MITTVRYQTNAVSVLMMICGLCRFKEKESIYLELQIKCYSLRLIAPVS